MLIERVFAALAIAVCAVLLVRLMIGEQRRWRLDSAFWRHWRSLRRALQSLGRKLHTARRWPGARRDAAKVAEAAIRRAREAARGGEWDGNVYKPRSFRKPPRDKMH